MVNAMMWILNAGSPWRDLPEGFGPWKTAYNRFNRWQKEGLFDRILERLQMTLDEEGRIDWKLWCVDGSSIRAHVSAAGAGKRGATQNPRTMHWVLTRWLGHEGPRGYRRPGDAASSPCHTGRDT